jgi:hypothetical protein
LFCWEGVFFQGARANGALSRNVLKVGKFRLGKKFFIVGLIVKFSQLFCSYVIILKSYGFCFWNFVLKPIKYAASNGPF